VLVGKKRRRFDLFCAEPKNRGESANDLISIEGAMHPSIKTQRSRHARLFPVCNQQHHTAPFQHIFELFCTEPKNRGESANDRISIKGASRPSIISQHIRHARLFVPSNAQQRATQILHIFELFCTEPKNRTQ